MFKAEAIRTNIPGCNEQSLFLFPSSKHSQDVLPALKNAGMTGYLSDYYTANASDIEAGALPYIGVNQESNVLDLIDMFQFRCSVTIKRSESVIQPEKAHFPNWEYDGESVYYLLTKIHRQETF